jgi:hypothetical protein
MQQSNRAIIWVGERVLDDRRRGMLDSARQAKAGDRQHDERGGRATTQDERVMDNVRRSGGRAAVSAVSCRLLLSFPIVCRPIL